MSRTPLIANEADELSDVLQAMRLADIRRVPVVDVRGALVGIMAFAALWGVMKDANLALTVAMTLFAASSLAAGIGLSLPWAFHRLGLDPAYGSGPLGTVLQDLLSLLVYFVCASLFLS